MTTTLDTSGSVRLPMSPRSVIRNHLWSDLTPFAQGYVEAALTGPIEYPDPNEGWGPSCSPKFGWLAPATLAAMMADCETLAARVRAIDFPATGKFLWEIRQAGQLAPEFPPITLYLSEDGLIHHRVAS